MPWNHSDWLSFAQAVGSIGAIFTALGIVFLQNWLDRKRVAAIDLNRASVCAAGLAPILERSIRACGNFEAQARHLIDRRLVPDDFADLRSTLERADFDIDPATLAMLIPLSKTCAPRIAYVIPNIRALRQDINNREAEIFSTQSKLPQYGYFARWIGEIAELKNYLELAKKDCVDGSVLQVRHSQKEADDFFRFFRQVPPRVDQLLPSTRRK